MSVGVAAALLVASAAFTYFFCIRPIQRGSCLMTSRRPTNAPTDLNAEIATLREEIETLKHQGTRQHPQPLNPDT